MFLLPILRCLLFHAVVLLFVCSQNFQSFVFFLNFKFESYLEKSFLLQGYNEFSHDCFRFFLKVKNSFYLEYVYGPGLSSSIKLPSHLNITDLMS